MSKGVNQLPIVAEISAEQLPKGTFGGSGPVFSGLTPTRVVFVSSTSQLTDDSGFTYDAANNELLISNPSASTAGVRVSNTAHLASFVAEYLGTGTGIGDADATYLLKTNSGTVGETLATPPSATTSGLFVADQVVLQALSPAVGGLGIFARAAAPIIFACGGAATTDEVGRFVAGTITFGTGGTNTFSLDTTNARLNVGTATTTSGKDTYVQKTVNGAVGTEAENLSNGSGAFVNTVVRNDNSEVLLIRKFGTGWTTSGLRVASAGCLSNSGAGPMILENLVASDTIFSNAGSAAANETLRVKTTGLVVQGATAIPAGGTAATGVMLSSTANFGIFFGSGAPSLSAAKGSLYLRSDGSTINDRAYINTNGSTTWTALVTAA